VEEEAGARKVEASPSRRYTIDFAPMAVVVPTLQDRRLNSIPPIRRDRYEE
jgi:hypothetical protein